MVVSYDKKMRARAKAEGRGLVTISWMRPNGARVTTQVLAGPKTLKYAQRALNLIVAKAREEAE